MKCAEDIEDSMRNGKRRFGRRPRSWTVGMAVTGLAILLTAYVANADDTSPTNGSGPAGAARLSSVEGQVRLMQGGQVLADPALVNAPLFAGMQIETGDDGKAEIQFEDGSVARLSPDTGLTLKSVNGDGGPGTTMSLDGGLAYFEIQGSNGQTQVIFGNSAATASGFTVMRIRMDQPPGELAVFSGNAHLERGNSLAVDLHGGESLTLDAQDATRYNLSESIEPDSWDAWNQDRDQALSAAAADQTGAASNFVNSETPTPAWNDLDANGNWYNVPGQGYVWSPFEASTAGWDPYGCGHWMWTPRWGYIWVSCESWGYLPFQCGAWNFYNNFGWGWSPGVGVGMGGGCSPWWSRGGYAGWNLGVVPTGYRPIPRPIVRRPPVRWKPVAVIAVNRGPQGNVGQLPARNRNAPVEIAGHLVQPMHPLPAHQGFVRSDSGFVYHPAMGYQQPAERAAPQPGVRVEGGAQVQGGAFIAGRPGGNDHPNNRQGYVPNQPGNNGQGQGFLRNNQQGQQPGRNYPQPDRGPQPGQFNQQPARNYAPPQNQPNRTYTPPPANRGGNQGGGFQGGGGRPSGGGGGGGFSGGGGAGGGGGAARGGGGGNAGGGGNSGHH